MAERAKPRMPAKPARPAKPRIPAKPAIIKNHRKTAFGKTITSKSRKLGSKSKGSIPSGKHIQPAVKVAKPSIGDKHSKAAKPAYFIPEIKSLKTLIEEIIHES